MQQAAMHLGWSGQQPLCRCEVMIFSKSKMVVVLEADWDSGLIDVEIMLSDSDAPKRASFVFC